MGGRQGGVALSGVCCIESKLLMFADPHIWIFEARRRQYEGHNTPQRDVVSVMA